MEKRGENKRHFFIVWFGVFFVLHNCLAFQMSSKDFQVPQSMRRNTYTLKLSK
jgi:hypothetical protein